MKNLFFSVFFLAAATISANENAPVGVRALSEDVQGQLKTSIENEKSSEPATADNGAEEQSGCPDCDYCPVFPNANHWIIDRSPFGDSITIEDGSAWEVSCFDTDRIYYWYNSDPVIITQNRSWFSSCQYRMINKNNGSSVPVDLYVGPFVGGEYSLQITNIDHYNGLLILSDQSHWKISSRDRYLFPEWTLGDYVILGVNSGWDSFCPFILINVNMNNFIRAKQY